MLVDDEKSPETKLRMAGNCSFNRVNAVYAAIAECAVSSENTTVTCIQNSILNKTNEKWGVFAKASQSVGAGVTYWYFNDCSIVLNNYGTFNRTYMIWSSQSYNSSVSVSEAVQNEIPTGNCSSSRI